MAMQNVFNILVDLKIAKSIPQPLVTQNDSVVFILEVMDNGVPFDLAETTTISLAHTRKDQSVVVTTGTKVGNIVTFVLGTNETAVGGSVTAKAQFYDATGRVSTLSFSYQVGLDPTGAEYVPSVVEQTLIQVVMADAQAKIDELSAVDVVDLSLQLAEKVTLEDVKTNVGFADINKNLSQIDETMLTDTLKQQMAGNTPVNATPIDGGVTTKKLANKAVSEDKTDFLAQNFFDKTTVTNGGYLDTSGVFVANPYFVVSDFIPCSSNEIYRNYIDGNITCYYDTNDIFITSNNSTAGIITVPNDPSITSLRFSPDAALLEGQMLTKGTYSYSQYTPFGLWFTKKVMDIEGLKNKVENTSKWNGKTWNVLGDSITEKNGTTTNNYHDFIKDKINCTINNYGISGTGYTETTSASTTDVISTRYVNMVDSADLVTVFAGINDFYFGTKLIGTFGDSTSETFYGAVDTTLKGLINKYPTKMIAVFTPLISILANNPNARGETLNQYVKAIIDVSNNYAIPVLDLNKTSNIDPRIQVLKDNFVPDGTHPNDAGHQRIADKILAFINTL